MTIKHKFQSPKSDGPNSTLVRPSSWNDDHDFESTSAGFVLGRDTSGGGDIQELPLEIDPDGRTRIGATSGFTPASGTSAQRPVAPRPGEIRWNSDLLALEVYGLGGGTEWTAIPVGGMVPAGFVIASARSPLPPGWLECNGATYLKTAKPALYDAIGDFYNVGTPPSDSFMVPDYRGKVLVGLDLVRYFMNTTRGEWEVSVTLTEANLPPHTHALDPIVNLSSNQGLGGTGGGFVMQDLFATLVATQPVGSGTPFTFSVEQPGKGIIWAIKE
jgi:microcystin-dependent protein